MRSFLRRFRIGFRRGTLATQEAHGRGQHVLSGACRTRCLVLNSGRDLPNGRDHCGWFNRVSVRHTWDSARHAKNSDGHTWGGVLSCAARGCGLSRRGGLLGEAEQHGHPAHAPAHG